MKKYNKPVLVLVKLDTTELLTASPMNHGEVGDKTQWHSKKHTYNDEWDEEDFDDVDEEL